MLTFESLTMNHSPRSCLPINTCPPYFTVGSSGMLVQGATRYFCMWEMRSFVSFLNKAPNDTCCCLLVCDVMTLSFPFWHRANMKMSASRVFA